MVVNAGDSRARSGRKPFPMETHWKVKTTDEAHSFTQEEVELSHYPQQILDAMESLVEISRRGQFMETGFFLAALANGAFFISPIVVGDSFGVTSAILDVALKGVLSSISNEKLSRLQFYHTHPPNNVWALTLSRADMDEAMRWKALLSSQGIHVPVDMHALPLDCYRGLYIQDQGSTSIPSKWSASLPI